MPLVKPQDFGEYSREEGGGRLQLSLVNPQDFEEDSGEEGGGEGSAAVPSEAT